MSDFFDVIQVGISCILMLFFGFSLARLGWLKDRDFHRFDDYANRFCFPVMSFHSVAMQKVDNCEFRPLFSQVAANVAAQIILGVIFLFPLEDRVKTYLNVSISGIFVNYLPIGLKVIESFYGTGYDATIGICPLSNFLILVPMFLIWAQMWHMKKEMINGEQRKITPKDVLLAFGRSIRNPIIIATSLGMAYSMTGWPYPLFLRGAGGIASDSVIVIALFSIGNVINNHGLIACHWGELVASLAVRFILCPCLAWLFVWLVGYDGLVARFCILFSALPASNGGYVIARTADVGYRTVSSAVVFSVIIVVPVVYFYQFMFDYFGLYPIDEV